MKIILLNGPPRCGKDTLGAALPYPVYSLATPLKDTSYAMFPGDTNRYNEDKEKPLPAANGMTRREIMIWLSEKCMKPQFGDDIFGAMLATTIRKDAQGPSMYRADNASVIVDCGFQGETNRLTEEFGVENMFLIRMTRENCDFSNDSRNYIEPLPGMAYLEVENNGSVADLADYINWKIQGFMHSWET
jgi:hypothetical protein